MALKKFNELNSKDFFFNYHWKFEISLFLRVSDLICTPQYIDFHDYQNLKTTY